MKCFLHIGTEKTATTTIQKFFDINRDNLLSKGFIYTKTAGSTNNRALPVAAYDQCRRDDFTKQLCINSDHELLAFQQKTIQSLRREIKAFRKDDSTIIFSSEHIQSRLTSIEEIERLREIICDLGIADISVVVYLRRPADIANSLYSTAIKAGKHLEASPLPKQRYWNNVCNHKNTIENFSSVFGDSAIIPRLFDKDEFTNGSIIDDILNVIGIPNDHLYEIPNKANESLSLTGIDLLRHLNKTIPRFIGNRPNPVRANLVGYIEKHFSDGKYVMPSYLYKEYDSEFQKSNDWVKEKYFPHKENLFSKEIPDEMATDKIPDTELKKIADFITSIWNDMQKK